MEEVAVEEEVEMEMAAVEARVVAAVEEGLLV
eukprot:COSAG05_NODE_15860_length_359_cov_0.796154_2_plen_32_part_00